MRWREVGKPAIKASFFTMKGVMEVFLGAFGLGERVSYHPPGDGELKFLHPGRAAKVMLDDACSAISASCIRAKRWSATLAKRAWCPNLTWKNSKPMVSRRARAIEPPPRFPAVRRDLALVIDREFPAAAVVNAIGELGSELLEDVAVFDVYEGQSIARGKRVSRWLSHTGRRIARLQMRR